MTSLPRIPPIETVPNSLAQLAFTDFYNTSSEEVELDWKIDPVRSNKINISRILPSYGEEELQNGVALNELVDALERSGSQLAPSKSATDAPRLEFDWTLGDTGLWVNLALGVVGTLSWFALILVCIRMKSAKSIMSSLLLSNVKGTEAHECATQLDWSHYGIQALVTLTVVLVTYCVAKTAKTIWTSITCDSTPAITGPAFKRMPRVTLYLELTNGFERVLLPMANLHASLCDISMTRNVLVTFVSLNKSCWEWTLIFRVSGGSAGVLRADKFLLNLPTIVGVPLLKRHKTARIIQGEPLCRLWAVDNFNIAYNLSQLAGIRSVLPPALTNTEASAPPSEIL